jgi:hypothetical protein
MKTQQNSRELKRVNELASDYKKKGYRVVLPRSTDELPAFLRNTGYLPDLLATSNEESFVIEVKSSQSTRELSQLSAVSDLVNSQDKWKFVLVLTNPRKAEEVSGGSDLSMERVRQYLEKSTMVQEHDGQASTDAAFLFAWVAVETSLRLLYRSESDESTASALTLIRNAVMDGRLERRNAQLLGDLMKVRSSLLHAGNDRLPTNSDVNVLRRVTEGLLTEIRNATP